MNPMANLDSGPDRRIMATVLPFPEKLVSARPMPPNSPIADHAPRLANGRDDGALWGRLMEQAQRGDRVAYHALLSGITPYVRSIARRYIGHADDADDAVQEILIVINDIRHTFEPGRPFKPWLSTIATRRCIDLLRRRTRRLQHEVVSEDDFSSHSAGSDTPEQATARLQTQVILSGAVDTLPARQREAIRLLHLNELSLGEAAERSGQSVGSLKVACHRALKALQTRLGGKD